MSSITLPLREQGIELLAGVDATARQRLAWLDLRDGLAAFRLAFTLGWLDIKLRYRGSVLGPFWLTLSTAIMILAMGAALLRSCSTWNCTDYMPYLALSLVLWNTLGGMVGGCVHRASPPPRAPSARSACRSPSTPSAR